VGTTTFFLRFNDLHRDLNDMTKEELKELNKMGPYGKYKDWGIHGWRSPMELHNGNVYLLVFWKGRLMQLEDAPKLLNKKYYHKYSGKTLKEYEWTILKKYISNSVEYLDKEFKKGLRRKPKIVNDNGVKK